MEDLNNRPQLPDIIPEGEVTVTGERHIYETFETNSGTEEKLEYTLDKAPINEIETVSGLDRNQSARTFNNGVDYVLSDLVEDYEDSFTFQKGVLEYELGKESDTGTITITDENNTTYTEGTDYDLINPDGAATDTIRWDTDNSTPSDSTHFTATYVVTYSDSVLEWKPGGDNLPEPGRPFFVEYTAPSVISRYLDTSEEKLDSVEDEIRNVIEGKFINTASGSELDEIGKLFGETIGKRRGRSDTQYRIYLRSVVQSFVSRGTVNGIKLAVSAATEVPLEDITINEDFDNNEYEIVIVAATPVTGSNLEEIAEIADPSGVKQGRTRFTIPFDEVEVNDSNVTPDPATDLRPQDRAVDDSTQVDDTVANPASGSRRTSDDATSDDTVTVPSATALSEDATASDAIATSTGSVAFWNDDNWDAGNDWASENN
jgi:hypothetical protein